MASFWTGEIPFPSSSDIGSERMALISSSETKLFRNDRMQSSAMFDEEEEDDGVLLVSGAHEARRRIREV